MTSSEPDDELVKTEQHLEAALGAIDDEQGRYHVRQALQLLQAERERE